MVQGFLSHTFTGLRPATNGSRREVRPGCRGRFVPVKVTNTGGGWHHHQSMEEPVNARREDRDKAHSREELINHTHPHCLTLIVMPGLEPGIQAPACGVWMAGSSPAMTAETK